MREWSGDAPPYPRQVDGYARAAAAGVAPRTPELPPPLLPGPTARDLLKTAAVKTGVAILLSLVIYQWLPTLGLPDVVESLIMLAGGLTPFVLMFGRYLPQVGDRAVQEMDQGYITLTLITGSYWLGRTRSWRGYRTDMPWDYRGLWVYGIQIERGVATPDFTLDPPGFYPSPNDPDALELWTGTVWSGHFRPWTSSDAAAQH